MQEDLRSERGQSERASGQAHKRIYSRRARLVRIQPSASAVQCAADEDREQAYRRRVLPVHGGAVQGVHQARARVSEVLS